MRKVFLDDLPRKGINNFIDWKNSVGYKVKFIYNDIEGEVEIINHIKRNLDIKYNNIITSICTDSFSKCKLGDLLGTKTKRYYYNIGDIVTTNSGKIEILEHIRVSSGKITHKGYKYKCLIDSNIDQINEVELKNGAGCNVCSSSGHKVLIGYNDLWTTHPKVAELLKYSNQGYEVSHGSHRSIIFVCPDCGYEREIVVKSVVNQGFSCTKCGDGISYPNKFVRAFLNQLNEEYIPEFSSDWSYIKHDNPKLNGKKKYDNLLTNKKEIWEVHGLQHYKESFKRISSKKSTRNLEEEQENDKIKKELAEQNGYKYIVIDARYSDLEYIKNSLLNIPEIHRYDLSLIDWLKCHEYACSSLVKEVCNLWNSGIRSTTKIGNLIKINKVNVGIYLKQGAKLGWCNYDPKEETNRTLKLGWGIKKRKVVQLDLNSNFIKEWSSITEATNNLYLSSTTRISYCCKNKYGHKSAGGFKWMYKEDYDEYIKNNKTA